MKKYIYKGHGLLRYTRPDGSMGHVAKGVEFESKNDISETTNVDVVADALPEKSVSDKGKPQKPETVEDGDSLTGINARDFLEKIKVCDDAEMLDSYKAYEESTESPRSTVLNAITDKLNRIGG